MPTRSRTTLLAILVLVVSAGCLANGSEPVTPRTPTGTWVQGTTPTDESPLVPTNAALEQFTTSVGVCERSNARCG